MTMAKSEIQERFRTQTIALLFDQVFTGIVGSVLAGVVVTFFLWDIVDRHLILWWLSIIIVISVFRTFLVFRYRKRGSSPAFYSLFLISLFFYGLAWGTIGSLPFPEEMLPFKTIIFLVLGGLIASVVSKYSARVEAVFCFCIPAAVPLIIHSFQQGSAINLYIAVITSFFLLVMLSSAIKFQEIIVESLETNETLAQETKQHKRTAEELKQAFAEIKILQGIIPICMYCKEVRDDEGSWNKLEEYISDHSEADFSHGICKKCLKKHW